FEIALLDARRRRETLAEVCSGVRGIADGSQELEGEDLVFEDQPHLALSRGREALGLLDGSSARSGGSPSARRARRWSVRRSVPERLDSRSSVTRAITRSPSASALRPAGVSVSIWRRRSAGSRSRTTCP